MKNVHKKRLRITLKYKSANPLFEKWLNEWQIEAKAKGSKRQYTYQHALISLRKCPIIFKSGQECKILKGFGEYICNVLDEKLKDHKLQEESLNDVNREIVDNVEVINPSRVVGGTNLNNLEKDITVNSPDFNTNKKKSKRKTKSSKSPLSGTQPNTATSSSQTSDVAEDVYSLEPGHFDVDDSDSHANTVKAPKTKRKAKTTITESLSRPSTESSNQALGTAEDFYSPEIGNFNVDDLDSNAEGIKAPKRKRKAKITKTTITESQSSASTQESSDKDFYLLQPGHFDVIFYIDTSEAGISDPLCKELSNISDVYQFEMKKLHVGDYIWVCRDKLTKKELVLPYIFERKRLDDFASSIKDGRYKEQKYRLKRSGIQHKYYLIEMCKKKNVGLPITSLQQAAINTAVHDGFKIKLTSDIKHTARYLNKFSYMLANNFIGKTLVRCSKENIYDVDLSSDLVSLIDFEEFNRGSVKNKPLKVTDMFIKMLIQIQGMSIQKAMALTDTYPTPMLLKRALDEKSDKSEFEKHLANLSYERQKIGPTLSKIVVQLFTSNNFR